MKNVIVLVSLFMGTYAHADYHGKTTCKGFYAASAEAVYNSQGATLGKKAVSEGKTTGDKLYTLSVNGGWPYLNETKSGQKVALDNAVLGDGMRVYFSETLALYPENVPGVSKGQEKVFIFCKTEQGGF